MVVNDDACSLVKRGALESIASKLAPTGGNVGHRILPATKKPPNLSIRGLFDLAVWLATWTRTEK